MNTVELILREVDNLLAINGELEIKQSEDFFVFGKRFYVVHESLHYYGGIRLYFNSVDYPNKWSIIFVGHSNTDTVVEFHGTLNACFKQMKKYLRISKVMFSQIVFDEKK
jgi:hypothetical protein